MIIEDPGRDCSKRSNKRVAVQGKKTNQSTNIASKTWQELITIMLKIRVCQRTNKYTQSGSSSIQCRYGDKMMHRCVESKFFGIKKNLALKIIYCTSSKWNYW